LGRRSRFRLSSVKSRPFAAPYFMKMRLVAQIRPKAPNSRPADLFIVFSEIVLLTNHESLLDGVARI
jgi:hypothetical protein